MQCCDQAANSGTNDCDAGIRLRGGAVRTVSAIGASIGDHHDWPPDRKIRLLQALDIRLFKGCISSGSCSEVGM